MTGVTAFQSELGAKKLELLQELVPSATTIAVLISNTPSFADWELMRQGDQGVRLEPLLEAISAFLGDQRDVIECIRRDLVPLGSILIGSRKSALRADRQVP